MLDNQKFHDISDFLDTFYKEDPRAAEIMKKSGFTEGQIGIVNTLIVAALQAYDRLKG